MYKTELHSHTSETSNCGKTKAKDLVSVYVKAGYKTVVITDHLSTHTYFRYNYVKMSWEIYFSVWNLDLTRSFPNTI